MELTPDKTVAEVVTDNIKASHVFKKYGIDFCCGGGISIAKACEKKGIDYAKLEEDLKNLVADNDQKTNFKNFPLDTLIDYIVEVHHKYVMANIPLLLQYSGKVAKVHGDNHPEVKKVYELFQKVASELAVHMTKEEHVLFPFIKKMVKSEKEGKEMHFPHFTTVANPIIMMEDEHEEAGNILKEIASLTNNYTPPKGACNTFRALYDKLEEFQEDLHQHIHLENNILHPEAVKLEKRLKNRNASR
ncbi:iron-sulfur cluster repair di-iron protein [Christiangramia fulva]|uniref:Iron-sulfur cluster repair di-iron protein n=1 Tax=Christiangramia fulva TaxID=2126553 RepID=A0A2R3Z264_9FLAO|nr:iron-sulfur cluster repair di-iron protein [Christiangramia fulva]AVR44371.1 iron-sulfur cluster repair di-iron protein [Christiangramia fulva]